MNGLPTKSAITALILACLISAPGLTAENPRTAGDRVLVVFRSDVKESKQVARYYAEKRGIPETNLCGMSGFTGSRPDEAITLPQYESVLLKKFAACLKRAGEHQILYVVLTYGMPYKLLGMPKDTGVSIDSYLAQPFEPTQSSRTNNPYFAANDPKNGRYVMFQSLADFRSGHPDQLIYSVWRLDGREPAIAKGLVDQAVETEKKGLRGTACFDRKYGNIEKVQAAGLGLGDWRLYRSAEFARRAGLKVIDDDHVEEFGTPPAPQRCPNAALFAGWYSLGKYNDAFDWVQGAIGVHLDSLSCTNPRAGYSWCANALMKGITVTSGAVAEPYLEGLVIPDGMISNLFEGATVGDAFLRNTTWLHWQLLNVGDPLYRPFPKRTR